MRVLFLSQVVPYPPHGGVLQRGFNLLRELGRDARVTLLAFVHPNLLPTPAAVEESRRVLGQFCETVEYFPLWAKTSPLHGALALAAGAVSSKPFSVIAHRSPAFDQRVQACLGGGAFDLVHADTLALSRFIPDGSTMPSVVTHHNIESMLMERRADVESRPLARRYLQRECGKLRAYERAASSRYDINIVVSEDDETALNGLVPGIRTAVVPNGVDTEYFTPGHQAELPALVYTGGMGMFANRDAVMHFLTDIWPLVRARVPAARFYAVGRAPTAEVKAIAARDPQVIVTDFVEDIRPIVRQSAVYVVPLRVGGGTRLKVLDAMAMGKALVSTSIGCEGIDVEPGRHLVVADTPEAFAGETVALMSDEGRRRALGREARALVDSRYAWPVVARSLTDAYRSAIELRRKSR